MKLRIRTHLDYRFEQPTDLLLQIEAAMLPEQGVESPSLTLSPTEHCARVAAHDGIGERLWLRAAERLTADYQAIVDVRRIVTELASLAAVPPHRLPGETVQYLMPSRYCPADRFVPFVERTFSELEGGAKIAAMRDWIDTNIAYVSGSSVQGTTATDTFVERQGVCRDFTHLLVTLARAAGIPARSAAVYAIGVEPQDFHAVAEVFLGGAWHLVDATGMASEGATAKIGVGRDAADIAFLTSFGPVLLESQTVEVEAI